MNGSECRTSWYILASALLPLAIIVVAILLLMKRKNKLILDNAKDIPPPEMKRKKQAPLSEEKGAAETASNPLILEISGKGIEIPLKPEPMTIGAYPDSFIVLDEETVSGVPRGNIR